jgi:hypothetical protein
MSSKTHALVHIFLTAALDASFPRFNVAFASRRADQTGHSPRRGRWGHPTRCPIPRAIIDRIVLTLVQPVDFFLHASRKLRSHRLFVRPVSISLGLQLFPLRHRWKRYTQVLYCMAAISNHSVNLMDITATMTI